MSAAHQIVEVNKHVSLYRGFTIQRLPRSAVDKNHRYQVTKDGMYYGQEFAQAEAIRTIDGLHRDHEVWCERLGVTLMKCEVTDCSVPKNGN
ncbi:MULTISPECIES: hypothetical protein [unclassified Pantoea]|uniref:hypothetical protein n=1 Tax=unclassified Pantoea TaxID=2630326 RepID=UPI0016806F99|nr:MULTISPECIES: hypothetical protein [unclassified Pantoea]